MMGGFDGILYVLMTVAVGWIYLVSMDIIQLLLEGLSVGRRGVYGVVS